MYYVYVLKKPDSSMVYIGYSGNLKQRIAEHSRNTNHRGWLLVYYEAYRDETDARVRERRLKLYGKVKEFLKKRIIHSINAVRSDWGGGEQKAQPMAYVNISVLK